MKVLLADDHAIVREGLKQILKKINASLTVTEASNGQDVLTCMDHDSFDFVVLDISMPVISGLEVLKILKDKGNPTRILVLSVHPQEQYAVRALNLGASGYLCKDSINEELESAIKTIMADGLYLPRIIAEKFIFNAKNKLNRLPHENLSEREFQIFCMIAEGQSLKAIAGSLCISDKTVSTFRSRILTKMNLKNNAEITRYAINNALI